MYSHFLKYWHIYALTAIMLVAFFIRSWNLEDTLYFKMDQARDATIAMNAHNEGSGMLTLLGPRAAGTFLRLGPTFYYFQYFATLISGSVEPHVMVFPELFFSLLTISLLYYFLRQFFKRETSVLVSGLYGFSFIATQYSRFAWNPNQTPFWGLLFLLGIYKSATAENKKHAGWWLVLAAVGYGVISQLHFTALLALPVVATLFWIFFRPRKIKPYFWAIAFSVLALFYVPMLLSELTTGWDNYAQFKYALTAKSEEFPLTERIDQSLKLHGLYYSLALTSYGNVDDRVFVYAFIVLLAFALWRGYLLWKDDENQKQKAFLTLIGSWFLVFSLLYTKLAFTVLKPRFWLLVIIIPYIFLALLFEWLYRPGRKKRGRMVVAIISSLLLGANLYAVGYWYWTLDNQREGEVYVRKLVLKQNNLVGLRQMRKVAQHMVSESEKTGKQICYYTEGEYRSPYEYIFRVYHPEAKFKRISFSKDTNDTCTYFSIEHGDSTDKINLPREHEHEFSMVSRKEEGVLVVWVIERKAQAMIDELNKNKQEEKENDQEKMQVGNADENEQEEKIKKLRRKERVFWKDVFSGNYED